MKEYFKRLKSHPGIPVVLTMQAAGVLTGLTSPNGNQIQRAILGFALFSLFWIPILWTNRLDKE